jgi:RHS repeat-associated protein
LTNWLAPAGWTGPNYTFLTLKERDVETGLDYFLARYYSSMQGRFTSPDEFAGGPVAVFVLAASSNPTFYADLTNPQSLNKYHYALDNPLAYVDPDGHAPCCLTDQDVKTIVTGADNIVTAVGKALGNFGIGINNLEADFGVAGAKHIEPYEPSNRTQAVAMVVTEDVTLFAGLLGGKAPAGVMTAESRQTAAVAAEVGNATRTAEQTASTLKPGSFSESSIPARGPQRNFNTAERAAGNAIGDKSGCHTCGAKTPGTKSGNWVLDHQPPTGVNASNAAQRLFPQCLTCSQRQGGDVTAWKKGLPGSP